MRKLAVIFGVALVIGSGCSTQSYDTSPAYQSRVNKRLDESAVIVEELLTSQDGNIAESLLRSAKCVAVLPEVFRGAFVVGGRYGHGVVSCQLKSGDWSPPAFVVLSAASVGFQIGADASDLILFLMADKARLSLFTDSLTLGGDISVTAGPVGRSAQGRTNFGSADVLSYASTKGVFAGLSLEGAVLKPDLDANYAYYQNEIGPSELLRGAYSTQEATRLQEVLERYQQ